MRIQAREITMDTAGALAPAGAAALAGGDAVFDFAGVERADSSAIAVMLGWIRQARQSGLSCRFVNLPAGLEMLLSLYGLDASIVHHHCHS